MTGMSATASSPEAWGNAVSALMARLSQAFCRVADVPKAADLSTIPKGKSGKLARVAGIVRPLDPSDPRSLSHLSHRERWLELARALGRLDAREEYDLLHGNKESHPSYGIAKTKPRRK